MKRKRKNKRKLIKVVFLLFVGYLVFNYAQGFYEGYRLNKDIEALTEKLNQVKMENNELLNQLEYIKTPEAIEKIAREKLGLVKPGESIIMEAAEKE